MAAKRDLDVVWFSTGKDDFLFDTTKATVAMLEQHGFDVFYEESAGGTHGSTGASISPSSRRSCSNSAGDHLPVRERGPGQQILEREIRYEAAGG